MPTDSKDDAIPGRVKKPKRRRQRTPAEIIEEFTRPIEELTRPMREFRKMIQETYRPFGIGEDEDDEAEAERPSIRPEPRKLESPRLDFKRRRMWLDGQWYDLKDAEANLFRDLFDENGGWVSLSTLGPNAAQIKFRMRKPLKDLIEHHRNLGYRIPRLLPA
jgi:hypothetical protein